RAGARRGGGRRGRRRGGGGCGRTRGGGGGACRRVEGRGVGGCAHGACGRGQGLRGTQLIPKPTTGRGAVLELIVIVALAIGLALGVQAVGGEPYQIPSEAREPH